jgi:hypothetical protein
VYLALPTPTPNHASPGLPSFISSQPVLYSHSSEVTASMVVFGTSQ